MITKKIRKIQENGTIQIPADERNAANLKKGDAVIIGLDKNKQNKPYVAVYQPTTKEDKEFMKLYNNKD